MELQHAPLVIQISLVAIMLAAVWFDVKNHRIPNMVSFSGWLVAPIGYYFITGLDAGVDSLLGLALLLAIGFPFFVIRWMGAGDVKLIAAVGGFVTVSGAMHAFMAIVLTGAVLGILQLAWFRLLRSTAERYLIMFSVTMASRRGVYLEPSVEEAERTMPYAVSIAIGTFIYFITG